MGAREPIEAVRASALSFSIPTLLELIGDARPVRIQLASGIAASSRSEMMNKLDALLTWTTRRSSYARAVVWAQNSHLGDARATQMSDWGELNLDQLARERHADRVSCSGLPQTGTATAAAEWDAPAERPRVTPSMPGSYERLFHDTRRDRFVLRTSAMREALAAKLERAIGVIYKPETERASHYFTANMSDQFDVIVHIGTTSALAPLEPWSRDNYDLPETYPTGA